MSLSDTSFELINQLSDERQALWKRGAKHLVPKERRKLQARLKQLDELIPRLWGCYRTEIASPDSEFNRAGGRSYPSPDVAWAKDSIWVLTDDQRHRSDSERADIQRHAHEPGYIDADNLGVYIADGLQEAAIEIRMRDADTKGRVPLKAKLEKRGETLLFMDPKIGSKSSILVPTT